MRHRRTFAAIALVALALAARDAAADVFSGRALLGYERHDIGALSTSGMRQTYDLHLEKALTTTSLVRLFFRGDDFRGTTASPFAGVAGERSTSRQLQPMGELVLNIANVRAQLRSEQFDIRSRTGLVASTRRIDRESGRFSWSPEALPRFEAMAQRSRTRDASSGVGLTDDNAYARLDYDWRGLALAGGERYVRSTDVIIGYDRRTTTHEATASYNRSALGGKLAFTANANGQFSNIEEQAVGGKGTSVPTPLALARALWGVDDTPSDDRDHPLSSYPALTDGNLNASAGISLGADAASFQNLALDIGRVDRVDEVRVVVRDAAGAPLRIGGGPVSWDVYTSDDGSLWAQLGAVQVSYNAALSLYSITFPQTSSRWFKVVSFGVNSEETLVTELQAYYHTTIAPGGQRSGTQRFTNAMALVSYRPVKPLFVTYDAIYSSVRQELATLPLTTSADLEHIGTIEYDIRSWAVVRGEFLRRNVKTSGGIAGGGADGRRFFLDITPTRKLTSTLEIGRQSENLGGTAFIIDTRAVHTTAFVFRSLSANLDFGTQTQTLSTDGSVSRRRYVTLSSNAQLTSNLRMLLTSTAQRNRTESNDPAAQLLGPERDNRITSQFTWRPGRQLALTAMFGWLSGGAISGFTHRYHADWYPFGDGTVSIGGSLDEDIDPVQNRRARRVIFNPRWMMNRYAYLDFNYASVNNSFAGNNNQQRSIYATFTLTK